MTDDPGQAQQRTRHAPYPLQAPQRISRRPRLNGTILTLTSLGIAVYFPLPYAGASLATLAPRDVGLAATYADRPVWVQIADYAHITFAGLALLLGPFQFSKTLRARHLRVHRAVGRTYVTACLVSGVAAFIMSFFSSVGLLGFFGFGSLAVLWVLVTVTGYRAIRRRDVASHQAWMMRSFALTFAAPTLRLWLFALLLPQVFTGVPFEQAYVAAHAPAPFLAWLPNLVVCEFMIRRRGLPALRLSPSPTAAASTVG